MITLRIEHAITDLDTWLAAFSRFEPARTQAGVRTQRIQQPVDDDAYVLVDLGFDSVDAAEKFRDFLVHNVWSNGENAPALVGRPITRILQSAAEQQARGMSHSDCERSETR